jgi:anaerobic magnesium-protoporphyrin IX monomethyl ester cyclase
MQLRPKAIIRTLLTGDTDFLHAMRWYVKMGRRVWFHEVFEFIKVRLLKNGPTLREFMGESLHTSEYAHSKKRQFHLISQGAARDAC